MIVKSNSFVEASYKMTLDEMRILSMTLGVFDPKSPKREFEFTVQEFVTRFPDVNPEIAYVQVQNAIRKICSRWMILVNNSRQLTEVVLVTDRTYFKKEGRFEIVFHEKLMPYITNLSERFTQYNLNNIGSFTSTHTIRIYELMSQYKSIGKREISIDDLKNWLVIIDKYPRFNSLNERVLQPSIEEINEKSDLLISVEHVSKGRKVVALKFFITEKQRNKQVVDKSKTKSGRYKLPQRPNVKVGPVAEGDWARECISVLNNHIKNLKERGEKMSSSDYRLLMDYHQKIGDDFAVKQIKNLLAKRQEQLNLDV